MENYYILNAFGYERCLNERNELVTKCLQQNKQVLKHFKNSNDR